MGEFLGHSSVRLPQSSMSIFIERLAKTQISYSCLRSPAPLVTPNHVRVSGAAQLLMAFNMGLMRRSIPPGKCW